MNTSRRLRYSAALAALGFTGALGLPQADATPMTPDAVTATSSFHLEYGASVLDGNVTWFNQSLHISGFVKAVTGSRQGEFAGSNGNSSCWFDETRTTPAGTTRTFGFDERCKVTGGFSGVSVTLADGSGNFLESKFIDRP